MEKRYNCNKCGKTIKAIAFRTYRDEFYCGDTCYKEVSQKIERRNTISAILIIIANILLWGSIFI